MLSQRRRVGGKKISKHKDVSTLRFLKLLPGKSIQKATETLFIAADFLITEYFGVRSVNLDAGKDRKSQRDTLRGNKEGKKQSDARANAEAVTLQVPHDKPPSQQ